MKMPTTIVESKSERVDFAAMMYPTNASPIVHTATRRLKVATFGTE